MRQHQRKQTDTKNKNLQCCGENLFDVNGAGAQRKDRLPLLLALQRQRSLAQLQRR
jgi:hypothetical protein